MTHALNLHRIGLTRAAFYSLVGYFLASLFIQQYLPRDEYLIHSPVEQWSYLTVFALLTIFYAGVQEYRRIHLHDRRWWRDYIILLASAVLYFTFFESFGYAKSLIPFIHPYTLDPTLQRIEMFIHGGVSPTSEFIRLAPTWVMQALASFYLSAWAVVMIAYFTWQLLRAPSPQRTLFLSSFIMLWIYAGVIAATMFASVGPIYYNEFYDDQFSAQNAAFVDTLYAHSSALSRALFLDVRQMLLDLRADGRITHFNGISAMPSLHVGIALLIMLDSFYRAFWLRFLTVPFALLIFLGSFALGWHYAIDSYVAAIFVMLIWYLNKREL